MRTITALDVGTLEFEKSIGTCFKDCGLVATIRNVMFLLEEVKGPRKIVVETGFESVEPTMAGTARGCGGTGARSRNGR